MKVCLKCGNRHLADNWHCSECGWIPKTIDGHLTFAPELAHEDEGFIQKYFHVLAKIENSTFWHKTRNEMIVAAIHRYFAESQSFLELGCGTGHVLREIRRACSMLTVVGADVSALSLSLLQPLLPSTTLIQADGRHLPYDQEFEIIGSFDVLEHVDDDTRMLTEMHRATRPGGGIILTVPQHECLWGLADEHARHKRRYARKELISKVTCAGFRVVKCTSFAALLFPAVYITRTMQRRRMYRYRHLSELSMPPLINALLLRILRQELRLIEAGVELPFGSSLMLVAHRVA